MPNNGYIGRTPGDSAVTKSRQTYNVTSDTTTFTFSAGYDVGYLDVYINGVRQIIATDYTASNGTTFVLTSAALNGDVVEAVAYKAFNLGLDNNVTSDTPIQISLVGSDLTFTAVGIGSTTLTLS